MHEAVAVVGDGPAGSALAAACAEAGLSTTLVGAAPDAVWPATYGAWVDELRGIEGIGGEAVWRLRFPDPLVGLDGQPVQGLGRAYGLLDNALLHEQLRGRLRVAGGRVVRDRVLGVAHDRAGSTLSLARGGDLRAGMVVDATGHRPALVEPGRGREPAWQVAFGVIGRLERPPVPDGGMWFMDWRAIPDGGPAGPPTFLYAMDLGGGRTFVEETSLAARPALGLPALRARLDRRLAAAGARVVEQEAVEQVAFPMGVPLPALPQPAVAFGAAAGMVHPATGFQVAVAVRRAPAVAAALAAALGEPGSTPATAASAAWAAVWPDDLRRQRDLHAYGLEILLGLDHRDTQRFFGAFFSLPSAEQRAYLSGASSSRELARVMVAVARRLPPRLAWRVTSGAVGGGGVALLRAALARGA